MGGIHSALVPKTTGEGDRSLRSLSLVSKLITALTTEEAVISSSFSIHYYRGI